MLILFLLPDHCVGWKAAFLSSASVPLGHAVWTFSLGSLSIHSLGCRTPPLPEVSSWK